MQKYEHTGSEDAESCGGNDDAHNARGKRRSGYVAPFSSSAPTPGQQKPPPPPGCYLHPDSTFRMVWDVIQIVFVIYISFVVPARVGLDLPATGFWHLLEWLMDVYFIIDLFVNFFTAYEDPLTGDLVIDLKSIAIRYLAGWFLIDLLPTIPISWFQKWANGSSAECFFLGTDCDDNGGAAAALKTIRILRLARMAKILRLVKISQVMARHEEDLWFIMQFAHLAGPAFVGILVPHLLACLFYQFSTPDFWRASDEPLICSGQKSSWYYDEILHKDCGGTNMTFPVKEDGFFRYVAAIYWGVTTFTTVGAGSMPANTIAARLWTILGVLLGLACLAWVIGKVGVMMADLNAQKRAREDKIHRVRMFCVDHQMPMDMRKEVMGFFKSQAVPNYQTSNIIHELPASIRSPVLGKLYGLVIGELSLFDGASMQFIEEVCTRMTVTTYPKGTLLFHKGEVAKDIYIISKGMVEVVELRNTDDPVRHAAVACFGEGCLFSSTATRDEGIATVTTCTVCTISGEELNKVLSHFPEQRQRMEEQYYYRLGLPKPMPTKLRSASIVATRKVAPSPTPIGQTQELERLIGQYMKQQAELKHELAGLKAAIQQNADVQMDDMDGDLSLRSE
eukprot:NODE_880_length_2017_cov_104.440338_g833_i0.p1 GENE.NODE_880_length_2017_cov_104.440338_g833_i0~~NODE_880_length_2017_cov_104.440338_g833_i0.p1  ORF type:complete len:646 (+),score=146.39 NODE_880_length_2017_cov_104.440338_g833_i0:77-1939(+)